VAEAREYTGAEPVHYSAQELREMSAVSTYDIPMHLAYYEYLRDDSSDMFTSHSKLQALQLELAERAATDKLFLGLTTVLAGDVMHKTLMAKPETVNWDCLNAAKLSFVEFCGDFSDYARKYVRVMSNLCLLPAVNAAAIAQHFAAQCPLNF